MLNIETRELTPELWPALEQLFGSNGACGGCWCMTWRVEKGEKWEAIKGKVAKQRFKKLVTSGRAHGILAFRDGEPVGWCSFDKRTDYAKLDRAPSLACDDADQIWSIPCFFIKSGYRKQGVAGTLLSHALKAMANKDAKIAEGYPVKAYKYGKSIPPAFAWTGTEPLFAKAGFKEVGRKDGGKQRVRKQL
jgi:predicted GNAT family acetyltransferase